MALDKNMHSAACEVGGHKARLQEIQGKDGDMREEGTRYTSRRLVSTEKRWKEDVNGRRRGASLIKTSMNAGLLKGKCEEYDQETEDTRCASSISRTCNISVEFREDDQTGKENTKLEAGSWMVGDSPPALLMPSNPSSGWLLKSLQCSGGNSLRILACNLVTVGKH